MKTFFSHFVVGESIFDAVLVLLAFLSGGTHLHVLWLGVAAVFLAKCLYIKKVIMKRVLLEKQMPVAAGLHTVAPNNLMAVSLNRRRGRIQQAIYLLDYWNRDGKLSEAEVEFMDGLRRLESNPTPSEIEALFSDHAHAFRSLVFRSDATI